MDVIFYLIPVAVLLLVIIVLAFVWAVRSGQFDDLEGPASRILYDDDEPPEARRTDSRNDR